MDIKIDNIESRMDKLEQKFDEMDRKLTADISAIRTDLKELMVSLQGNSIQEGMVVRTRKDIDALQDEMRHIRRNQLRDDQIKSLLSSLGFTPTDRAKLGVAEVKQMSKLDAMRARKAT